jgi:hypothetical protein
MTSALGNAISVVPLKENWVDFQALLEFKEGRIPSNIRQGWAGPKSCQGQCRALRMTPDAADGE